MMAFMGILGIPEIFIIILMTLPFLLTVWALIDVVRSSFKDDATKIIWALAILLLPFFGALLYFLIGRGQKSVA